MEDKLLEDKLQSALSDIGLQSFRPLQRDAVTSVLEKQDTVVIVATGGGKSLCYQLPAIVSDAITLVISPLISLAKDQVDNWNARGSSIGAQAYNCTVPSYVKEKICKDVACGEAMLLYTTPEALIREQQLRDALQEACEMGKICCLAVDEAHCVSQWGHDFRHSYLELVNLRATAGPLAGGASGPPPMICLTATCTDTVLSDVVSCLGLRNPRTLKHSFNRPNLQYSVRFKDTLATSCKDLRTDSISEGVVQDICKVITDNDGESGIIYCRTRDQCEGVAKAVNSHFCENDVDAEVAYYHAGLGQSDRNRIQQQWSDGSIVAVVATIAFGMGIDKSDIRWVIHWSLSGSLEAFSQESGRAGRDGEQSMSILYVSPADIEWCTKICKAHERPKVGAMVEYAQEVSCRRAQLLSYFNEKNGRCKPGEDALCDVCACPAAVRSAQAVAEKKRVELEAAAAAEAAKENSSDAAQDKGGQQKASWHRATGAVAKPQPPRQITPCQDPAPSAACHSMPSTGPAQPPSATQPRVCARLPLTAVSANRAGVPCQATLACPDRPVQMLRTPNLRTKASGSDGVKEVPGRLGSGMPPAARDTGSAPLAPAVPAGLKPVAGKRKFVPPRSAS